MRWNEINGAGIAAALGHSPSDLLANTMGPRYVQSQSMIGERYRRVERRIEHI